MESASFMKSGIAAYNNALKSASSAMKGGADTDLSIGGRGEGNSFESFLSNTMKKAAGQLQSAEKVSLAALEKKASPVDLVTSVTQAELTLQTLVAVRDKVVNAYMEIYKMPI